MTPTHSHPIDLQAGAPALPLTLDSVGVTGIVRGVLLGADALPATARIDVSVELPADARGAHMSRFHESIDQSLLLAAADGRDVPSLEVLTAVIAARAADLQEAPRARARTSVTVALPSSTPETSRRSLEPVDAWAEVEIDRSGDAPRTTTTLGVAAQGITACPCAQLLVRDASRDSLLEAGHDAELVEAVLDSIPVATHNQRSTGTLELRVPGDGAVTSIAPIEALAELVRGSMSARIHELLKRGDERAVVESAHGNPRFVEDCVRQLLAAVVHDEQLAGSLSPATWVTVRQRNHESIHAHDVVATRSATIAELRSELGEDAPPA